MKAWVFTESYNNYKNKQRPGLVCSNKKPSTERTSICQTVGASIEVHILTGAQLDAIAKAAFEEGFKSSREGHNGEYPYRNEYALSDKQWIAEADETLQDNLNRFLASDEYKKLVGGK